MKSVIILAFLVSFANAGGSVEEFQSCLNEAITFKQCIFHQVNETMHKNFEHLKQLKDAIGKCFENPEIKSSCALPAPPQQQHDLGSRPTSAPSLCFEGARTAFQTCFKAEAGIPEGFNFDGFNQGHQPPPFLHNHFSPNPQEIKKKVLEFCKGNQGAADKLEACAKAVIKPFLPSLIAHENPKAVVCNAASACEAQKPISGDCKAKLQQGAKAYCACRPEFDHFINSSDACAAVRAEFEQYEQEHVASAKAAENAVAVHHDIPHHPHEYFDFCSQHYQHVCKDVSKQVENAQAGFGQ